MIKQISSLICLACGLALPVVADPMDVTPLTLVSDDAVRHEFTVEVANDREEISYGLMNRESMDADKGMLFDFDPPYEPSMYMKNTLIPLDMLFIANDGRIEMIARNTVPGSLRTISPGVPVRGVLELNGGLTAELDIKPGDFVVHPIFDNLDRLDAANGSASDEDSVVADETETANDDTATEAE